MVIVFRIVMRYLFFILFLFLVCESYTQVLPGANQTTKYFPLLEGKNVAVVANQTSIINQSHLVDSLISQGIPVKKIFCPEHGFRGVADAGEEINSTTDKKTGLPIVSLYGKNKKPSAE